uniref:Retinol dehydrogenase n=1 Tax=Parastrongyloides trichosuri TaxID=131310 RepID=A0A0N4ZE41_PARTI
MLDSILILFLLITIIIILLYILTINVFQSIEINEISNKCIIITGCDTGFGKEIAIKANDKGFIVFACCLTKVGVNDFERINKRIIPYHLDITNEENVDNMINFVMDVINKSKSWKLHALINNASIFGAYGPDDWTTLDNYADSINVNVIGTIRVIHKVKEHLKKSNGRIITMSSCVSNTILPYAGPYNVSKRAIEGYMDTLRLEMKNFNVMCVVIQPSCYKTEMLHKLAICKRIEEAWNKISLEMKAYYQRDILVNFKEEYFKFIDKNASKRLEEVTNCYMKALSSKYPKPRYQVGLKSQTILKWLSLIPTSWSDVLVYQLAMKTLENILHSNYKKKDTNNHLLKEEV